jgi:NADPH:quinone reductase-like Zn-dependent oxidoreductase
VKAVQFHRYGPPNVLEVIDIPAPTVGEGQALVRVVASSVNPVDWHTMRGQPFLVRLTSGLRRPKNPGLGADVAGVVEAVGPGVTNVKPGDEVLGMSIRTFAELVAIKAEGLVPKPPSVSFEQAGAIGVAALTALQGLRDKGHVGPGQRVLVSGAGGGVGHFAVQIAKALGAEVTATTSPEAMELVRSLGADEVVDYTKADATAAAGRFDVVFDAGGWLSLRQLRRALKPGGTAVLSGAGRNPTMIGIVANLVGGLVLSRATSKRFASFLANRTQADLITLRDMLESGQLRAVIDRRYPLSQIAEAVRYQETGRAHGKVAVAVGDGTALRA